MKYYIYKDTVLNKDDFLEKAKIDFENEDDDIIEDCTFEEYIEDIYLLNYNVSRILDIDEEELKKCKTTEELDCAVLDILSKDIIDDEFVDKYINVISMRNDYEQAFESGEWRYDIALADGNWFFDLKFEVLEDIPFNMDDEDYLYSKVRYKGFEIVKEEEL